MIISGFDDFTVFGSFSILSFILEFFSFPDFGCILGSCSYVVPRFMSDSKNQTLKDTTQEMTRL